MAYSVLQTIVTVVCLLCQFQVIAPKNVKCKWHTFSNTVGKSINFECPENHFMAGLKSVYNTKKSDRQ